MPLGQCPLPGSPCSAGGPGSREGPWGWGDLGICRGGVRGVATEVEGCIIPQRSGRCHMVALLRVVSTCLCHGFWHHPTALRALLCGGTAKSCLDTSLPLGIGSFSVNALQCLCPRMWVTPDKRFCRTPAERTACYSEV